MSVDERECDAVTNRPIREQHFIDHAPTQQRGVVHGGAHGVKKWGRGVVDGANSKWWQSKKKGKEGGKNGGLLLVTSGQIPVSWKIGPKMAIFSLHFGSSRAGTTNNKKNGGGFVFCQRWRAKEERWANSGVRLRFRER